MTEEEQLIVARAVLAGVRFYRHEDSRYGWMWRADVKGQTVSMFSLPRAANRTLEILKLRPVEECKDYEHRTNDLTGAIDVDEEFISAVLPGWQRDAGPNTEECLHHATDSTKPTIQLAGPQPSEQQADA